MESHKERTHPLRRVSQYCVVEELSRDTIESIVLLTFGDENYDKFSSTHLFVIDFQLPIFRFRIYRPLK